MFSEHTTRVLLVTGSDVLKYQLHLVPTCFYQLLEEADGIAWDHAVTAEAALAENACADYDAMVFFCFHQSLSELAVTHLRAFVESGKGLLVVHSGLASFPQTEMWAKEVVGVRYRHAEEEGGPKTVSTLDVNLAIHSVGDHPVNRGIAAFELVDEAYKGLEAAAPVDTLFETDHPASDGPIAWIGPSTANRTIVLEPGHTAAPFLNPTYREVVQRALAWVCRIGS